MKHEHKYNNNKIQICSTIMFKWCTIHIWSRIIYFFLNESNMLYNTPTKCNDLFVKDSIIDQPMKEPTSCSIIF